MPSIYTIEMFSVVIASAWHELIPPLLFFVQLHLLLFFEFRESNKTNASSARP